MARQMIVAQFHEYAAAHRAPCELIQTNRDFGIIEKDADIYIAAVRRGAILLAVDADDAGQAQVAEIIEHHVPIDIAERGCDRFADAASGAARGQARPDGNS